MSWYVQIALEKWEQELDDSNVDEFHRVPEEYRFQRFKLGLIHFQTQYLKEVKEETIKMMNNLMSQIKKTNTKIFGVRILKELKYLIQAYYVQTHHEYHAVGIDDDDVESSEMVDLGYEKYYQYYIGFIHLKIEMVKACDEEIDTLINELNELTKKRIEKKKEKEAFKENDYTKLKRTRIEDDGDEEDMDEEPSTKKQKVESTLSTVMKKKELIEKINQIIKIGTTYKLMKINEYKRIGLVRMVKQNIPYGIFPAAKRDDQTLIKIPSLKTFGKPEDVEAISFVQAEVTRQVRKGDLVIGELRAADSDSEPTDSEPTYSESTNFGSTNPEPTDSDSKATQIIEQVSSYPQ